MAQVAKIIDLTKSFVPVDGRTFPENFYVQKAEDSPVDTAPIVAYQGYNFLPTAYGYKSYFGVNAALGIDALTSKVDKLFIFQTQEYENFLIALCEDGIWVKNAESAGAWTHQVDLPIVDEDIRYDWTYCVIEKGLYCYRANGAVVYFLHPDRTLYPQEVDPPAISFSLSSAVAAGTVPDGTYLYQIAVKQANGNFTTPTAAQSITISGGPKVVALTITTDLTAYSLIRIYRTDPSGLVSYWDEIPQTGTYWIVSDSNQDKTVTTLPDYSGMTEGVDPDVFRSFTPSFLNMEGQHGIFRSGQRLGFWDSENSVAWSSIDDLSEFTPSVETLAGSAIFGDVTGRITTIIPHGEGFIIYSKKSIVWVRRNVAATFQWDPLVVLTSVGVAFPEEACAGNPDTVHYAWTSAGLYKIENGRPEVIVPELTDFLKDMELPLFMDLLQGRYLCLQVLDPDYVDGKVVLSTAEVDPFTITLSSGAGEEDLPVSPITLTGNDACSTVTTGKLVHGTQGAIQDQGLSGAAAKKAGVSYEPVYRAYFSQAGAGDPDSLTWTASPCSIANLSGTPNPYPMSPATQLSGKLSFATQTTAQKIDAGTSWDPLQFYQAQLAIWEEGNKKRKALLQKILARAHESSVETTGQSSCTPSGPTEGYCDLGDWIADVSYPHWGINSCSFWVTRYIIAKMHIQTYTTQQVVCTPEDPTAPVTHGWNYQRNAIQSFYHSTYAGALTQLQTEHPTPDYYYEVPDARGPSTPYSTYYGMRNGGPTGSYSNNFQVIGLWIQDSCPPGYTATEIPDTEGHATVISECIDSTPLYTRNQINRARNIGELSTGVFGVDTGLLILVGWNRRNPDGSTTFVARSSSTCTIPDQATPPSGPSVGSNSALGGLPMDSITGSMCGVPFEPVTLEGLELGTVNWPDFSITFPGDTFLLQKGSIGPKYPDIFGALVYDTHLKKWGKMKCQYKRLLNYSPINVDTGYIIPYSTFGIEGGLIKDDGFVYLFDPFPSDSKITYGKLGYYRLGFTDAEELRASFKEPFEGLITVEGSLDGHNLEVSFSKTELFSGVNVASMGCNISARWFNFTISGIFDLTHLEFRGTKAARR